MFGADRLAATLVEFHDGPAHDIRERILEPVFGWMHHQDDDMTLLVARCTGRSSALQ